jgi:enolase
LLAFLTVIYREELEGSGATYAGERGLSAGLTPPELLKK